MHRRATHAFPATVTILDESDLPEYCRYGIFSEPGKLDEMFNLFSHFIVGSFSQELHSYCSIGKEYEAILRLSSGASSFDHEDKKFAVKGLALKVKGLNEAPSCFEQGTTTTEQNFVMNALQPTFPATAEELANVAVFDHFAKGNDAKLAMSVMKEYGFHGLSILSKFVNVKLNDGNFSGYASSWFSTGLPHKFGPYAVKLRLQPSRSLPVLEKSTNKFFWTDDIEKHLINEGELVYDLQLQFFIDEESTPIENGFVEWSSEFNTVAKVTIKKESLEIANSEKFKDEIEMTSFSPWKGLEDHRPLGRVMRARKKVYYEAAKARGAS